MVLSHSLEPLRAWETSEAVEDLPDEIQSDVNFQTASTVVENHHSDCEVVSHVRTFHEEVLESNGKVLENNDS